MMDLSIKPLIDATHDNICWIKSNASSNVYEFQRNDDYDIELTNGYEEGLFGVHLKNKKQQDKAMEMFVAGITGCSIWNAFSK